jgi:hypothetical protein
MNNYYFLSWKHTAEVSFAYYEIENQVAHELISKLHGKKTLPLDFELKRVQETKDGLITDNILDGISKTWLDYQPNSLAWPLMSKSLKSSIEDNLSGNENIDWIECNVKKGNEIRPYYILRFNKILDVLDMEKTMFVHGTELIIRPVFSMNKIIPYNIFMAATSGYGDLWRITS